MSERDLRALPKKYKIEFKRFPHNFPKFINFKNKKIERLREELLFEHLNLLY